MRRIHKKFFVTLLSLSIFFLFFIPIENSKAITETYRLTWASGTVVDLRVYIESDELNDGTHSMSVTVELVSLNPEAVDIHDIMVSYQIPGRFSSYVTLATISSVGGSSYSADTFQYYKNWGTVNFEFSIDFRENIPLAFDPELYSDWIIFFTISPYQYSPPSSSDPPENPSGNTNGFNFEEYWYVFVITGVVLVAASGTVAYFIRKNKGSAPKQVITQVASESHTEPRVVDSSICPHCKSKLDPSDRFCNECGAKRSNSLEF